MAELIDRAMEPGARRRGFAAAAVVADWPLIVGERLSRRCQPIRLSFPRGQRSRGTLLLHASVSAAVELSHSERQVLERINGHFGFLAVARLRIVQAPLGRPLPAPRKVRPPVDPQRLAELTAMAACVGDSELALALVRLGSSICAGAEPRR